MKILIIRHGDPNYVLDTLTPKGEVEATLLAKYLKDRPIDSFYLSPLGRAQKTAEYTLNQMGRTGETLDWLREFPAKVRVWEDEGLQRGLPYSWDDNEGEPRICWDILPSYFAEHPELYHKDAWRDSVICRHSETVERYADVAKGLDEVLARHGYVRDGVNYRVEKSNDDTIVFFCHFGVECVMLSHLFGVSPFVLWHNLIALPTSVTTLCSEEREQGIAIFRASGFGDLSHLALGSHEPSFSGRYCERFEDDTIH